MEAPYSSWIESKQSRESILLYEEAKKRKKEREMRERD